MIKISVRGINETLQWLDNLAKDIRMVATRAMAEYLVGDESHGLKHYPPYKHVPWSAIGGFVSEKQRRYVMANIRNGNITPGISASNGYLRDAWQYTAKGTNYVISNDVKYAPYLVGQGTQSRRAIAQAWRTTTQTIKDNWSGAIGHAKAAIKEWIAAHRR